MCIVYVLFLSFHAGQRDALGWVAAAAATKRSAMGPCCLPCIPQNSGFFKCSYLLCRKGFLHPKNWGSSEIKKVNKSIYSRTFLCVASKERRFLSIQALAVGADKHALQFIFRMLTGALSLGELGLGQKESIIKQSWSKPKSVVISLPLSLHPHH